MKPYYQRAGITIYNGDGREILPGLSDCDLVLTDPPYGLGAARKAFHKSAKRHVTGFCAGGAAIAMRDYGDSHWDDSPVDPELLALALSKGVNRIVWGGNYFDLPRARCWLVWDKLRGDTCYADGELAWTNLDRPVRIFRYRWNGFLIEDERERRWRVHPTQKPVALMSWCIRQAPVECKTILDPFMGTGSALRAAKDLGIRAIGIEREEKYCEIAAERMAQEVGFALPTQLDLSFDGGAP